MESILSDAYRIRMRVEAFRLSEFSTVGAISVSPFFE